MNVLDLDLDFFMNVVTTQYLERDNQDDDYWTEEEIRDFLENTLGLSKHSKLKGVIVNYHKEAYTVFKELALKNGCKLNIYHIDSHADLGLGSGSWGQFFTIGEYTTIENFESNFREEFHPKDNDYLLFLSYIGVINEVNYVYNRNLRVCDLDLLYEVLIENVRFEKYNIGFLKINKKIMSKLHLRHDFEGPKKIKRLFTQYQSEITSKLNILAYDDTKLLNARQSYSYVLLSKSPDYTHPSMDKYIDVVKEYIETE